MQKEQKKQRAKDTGLALVLILLLLLLATENRYYTLAAIGVLVLTMTWPKIFTPFSYVWFGFSKILGETVSKLILTVVFFIIIVPVGFVREIIGFDSMRLKSWKQGQTTFFIDRDHTYSSQDLKNPY